MTDYHMRIVFVSMVLGIVYNCCQHGMDGKLWSLVALLLYMLAWGLFFINGIKEEWK